MVKYSFVFFIIFLAGIIYTFSCQTPTFLMPGYFYPCWDRVGLWQVLWLGVTAAIYFIIEKKGLFVSKSVFYLHFFPSLLVFYDNSYTHFKVETDKIIWLLTPFIIFVLGQLIFLIGVVRAKSGR